MTDQGLIHVYYGSGKGKTTAALGLALRASGAGLPVVIVQFLKNRDSGELHQLAYLEQITVLRGKGGNQFVRDMDQAQKVAAKAVHDANLRQAVTLCQNGANGILILDECLDACQLGLLDEAELRALIMNKPEGWELVITGHTPLDWMIERADYVTEMVKHKHPYDLGVAARKGIEY